MKKVKTYEALSIISIFAFLITSFLLVKIQQYNKVIDSVSVVDAVKNSTPNDWDGEWTYGSDGGTNGVIKISQMTSRDFVFSLDNFLDNGTGGTFGNLSEAVDGKNPVAQIVNNSSAIFSMPSFSFGKDTICNIEFNFIKKDILNVTADDGCSEPFLYEGVYVKKGLFDEPKELTLRYLLSTNAGLIGFYNDNSIATCARCDLNKDNLEALKQDRDKEKKYWIVPKTVFPRQSDIRYPDFVTDNKINSDWAMIDYVWTRDDTLNK